MRTSPAYAPDITVGTDGTRAAPGAPRMSILMPPGTYTVKLVAGGQQLSQPLIVRKDPNSSGTEADIAAQVEMLSELRRDLESGSAMVNQIELIRSQLYQISSMLGTGRSEQVSTESGSDRVSSDFSAIKSAAEDLDKKLIEVEENLIQRKLTGQGQDTVRWPPKLLSKINYLASGLAGSDFGPTSQQREVHTLFKQQLTGHKARLDELLSKDLEAFNRLLRERGIQNVITRVP